MGLDRRGDRRVSRAGCDLQLGRRWPADGDHNCFAAGIDHRLGAARHPEAVKPDRAAGRLTGADRSGARWAGSFEPVAHER